MSNLPRFHCPTALSLGDELELPAGTARHVQVRRMQPDDVITLFNGEGGEFKATILRMGRSDVAVRVVRNTRGEQVGEVFVSAVPLGAVAIRHS